MPNIMDFSLLFAIDSIIPFLALESSQILLYPAIWRYLVWPGSAINVSQRKSNILIATFHLQADC